MDITKEFLTLFKKNSIHLRYLNISQVVSGDKLVLHQLLETILSIQYLQICYLRLGIGLSPFPLKRSSKGSIKELRLIGMHENFSFDRLIVLIENLPYLRKLYIVSKKIHFIPEQDGNNSICTVPIVSFTLNINELNIPFTYFTNCIIRAVPYVEEIKIKCRTPLTTLDYLNVHDWINFAKSLSRLCKITIDISRGNAIDEQIWTNKCQSLLKKMVRNHIDLRIGK